MIIKKCERCGFEKDWSGSDIRCPFQESDTFSNENWNCGIINRIRDICFDDWLCDTGLLPEGIDYQFCDDNNYSTIKIDNIECNGEYIGLALWVAWYKRRGRTDAMWILDNENMPRLPTFDELVAIADYYEKLQEG